MKPLVQFALLVLSALATAQGLTPELERATRSGDAAKRRQALVQLTKVPGQRALEILLERCCKDADPFVRDEASQVLVRRRKDGQTVPFLARELDRCHRTRRERDTALTILGILGQAGRSAAPALPALARVLGASDPELRERAAWVLGRTGAAEALSPLLERLSCEREPRVKGMIADALGRCGLKQATDPLSCLAGDPDPLISVPALGSLRLADRSQTLALATLGSTPDRARVHRLQAVASLAWLGEPACVPPLIGVLQSAQGRLLLEAREALVAITGMKFGLDPLSWRHWWETEGQKGGFRAEKGGGQADSSERSWGYYHGHRVTSDHLIFLIDASGSMLQPHGTDRRSRYEHACDALEQLFAGMPPETRFNVILFSRQSIAWEKQLSQATEEARKKALQFVRRYSPMGPTNLLDPLVLALRTSGVDTLYLLTDGVPTEGTHVLCPPLCLAVARENLFALARIHTISLGGSRPSKELLTRLAGENRGESR